MKGLALRIGLIGISILGLVQCGEDKSVSSKVDFEILPKSPIVILSDFTLNPGTTQERKVTAPWFTVNYTVTNNNADKTITIQSLLFRITAVSTTGGIVETVATIDPADFEDELFPQPPTYLSRVPPGATVTPTFSLYVDSLDKNVPSLTYSVTVEVQGWVGEPHVPEDRLYKTVSFSTR